MINLNKGGLIGGLLPLAIGIIVMLIAGRRMNPEAMDYGAKAIIGAVVTGAVLGNFLWERFVAKPPPEEPRDRQILP